MDASETASEAKMTMDPVSMPLPACHCRHLNGESRNAMWISVWKHDSPPSSNIIANVLPSPFFPHLTISYHTL